MFKLPPLPYEKNAFPHQISVETFDYHYGKHHQAYINNLNDAIANNPAWQNKSLEEIIIKYPLIDVGALTRRSSITLLSTGTIPFTGTASVPSNRNPRVSFSRRSRPSGRPWIISRRNSSPTQWGISDRDGLGW